MKYTLFLLLGLMSTSCATIMNSTHCTTNIRTGVPITAIVDSDTIELRRNKNNIIVSQRNDQPRKIVLIKDTVTDTIALIPRWSDVYYLNYNTLGIGFLVDRRTPKKWSYPHSVRLTDRWIGKNHTAANTYPGKYTNKGTLNLQLGVPHVNWFCLGYETTRSSVGFWGISLGMDYFYKDKAYLNISGNGIANIFIPFPAAVDWGGIQNHMYSVYVSASNNHMLFNNRFSFGYGISYGHDTWDTINHGRWDEDTPDDLKYQENIHRKSNSFGLVFPFCYYIKRSFYLGLIYRPMLVQFTEKTRFKYQHTTSFEFGWRLRLI